MLDQWNHKMFKQSEGNFDDLAIEAFHYQYTGNPVYRRYVDALGTDITQVKTPEQVPFLPISFFKTQQVKTGIYNTDTIFESSGTTGNSTSRHWVRDTALYRESFIKGFTRFYGPPGGWCILGLLPSYLERKNSSLVFMVHELIKHGGHPMSGFYLDEYEKLNATLLDLESNGQKTLLIGVTFALLDFAAQFPQPLKNTVVMETGGMKGRRKEMIREEVHDLLKKAFSLPAIHSEYGMTELLSQAYSSGNGIFHSPPWLKIMIRDEEDPLTIKNQAVQATVSGAINVIDLANIHSSCFIATDDAGRLHPDGSFEVIGRLDNSDLRGCSLLAAGF